MLTMKEFTEGFHTLAKAYAAKCIPEDDANWDSIGPGDGAYSVQEILDQLADSQVPMPEDVAGLLSLPHGSSYANGVKQIGTDRTHRHGFVFTQSPRQKRVARSVGELGGGYTPSYVLIESQEGLDERQLIHLAADYWLGGYDGDAVCPDSTAAAKWDRTTRLQIFDLPYRIKLNGRGRFSLEGESRNDHRTKPPSADYVEAKLPWPPVPISYRADPIQFWKHLVPIRRWIAAIEHNGLRHYYYLPPFRDTRGPETGWPELADIPASTIPDPLPAPRAGMDYYLVPLWNEC
jgi:hypothetical protein